MADAVPGPAGSTIIVEDVVQGDATTREMPVSKIRTGEDGVDGGDVTGDNPFPTEDLTTNQLLEQILITVQTLLIVSKNIDLGLSRITGHLPVGVDGDNPF